ncbi:hypothetical protein EDB83DRAFT_2321310 [Lactarius deliciosus]|nr:hypothetical protein EDB83DRAFT_2321310 [Lactarius deliciosus]
MKRPSDPSSPTPESKWARQEILSPSSQKLKHFCEDLKLCIIPGSHDKELDFNLDALTSLTDEAHLGRLVAKDVFKDNVQKHREQFFQLLGKVLEGSIDAWSLIDHSTFWTDLSPPQPSFNFNTESRAWSVTEASQREAIENSWIADFIDQSPLEGLRVHIVEQLQLGPSSEAQIYGRYCSIVQSSGMGKSRLLDKFSKNFFLIPINLRASTDQGYPPADSEVRNFLTRHDGVHSALSLMQHFLLALFSRTKATLERMGSTKSGQIQEFREYMSKDQTMHSSGGNRSDFYDGVIAQARLLRGQDKSNRINDSSLATPCPYIHLGFDQLMQSRKILDRWTTLDHVVSLECIAHMGRPLWGTRYDHSDEDVRRSIIYFAVQKLLCGNSAHGNLSNAQIYAVLSQRLALDINTPQYLFDLSSPLNAMRTMHEQIVNHMRVCMAVGSGIESLRGIASSEPILLEAASIIMLWSSFDFPRALSLVLTGFSIDQGDRGELLVAAFFTWACDQLTALFGKLFTKSMYSSISGNFPSLCHTKSQRPFEEVFKEANMHFNHVVKPQVQKLLARRFLLYFMARGAAALGANCQPGFDAVYPYLYGSLDLNVKNVGFIIVQVKNDSSASGSDYASIFKKMDPFKCGLLGDSDKVNGRFPIPIIRILFSLMSSEKNLTQMMYEVPTDGAEDLKDGRPLFTSYDFMCSGVDTFLRPVDQSPDAWKALVNKPDQWRSFYNVPVPNVLRSQMPACGDNEAHFNSWLGVNAFP